MADADLAVNAPVVEGWWQPKRAKKPHYFVGAGGLNPWMMALCEHWRVEIEEARDGLRERVEKREACGVCFVWWRLRTRQYAERPAYRNFK